MVRIQHWFGGVGAVTQEEGIDTSTTRKKGRFFGSVSALLSLIVDLEKQEKLTKMKTQIVTKLKVDSHL